MVAPADSRSERPTVLVTGAAGQLGRYLMASLAEAGYPARGTDTVDGPGVDRTCDITDAEAVRRAFADLQPGVVIHGAAYTDVDGCERNPDLANRVNGAGAGNIARAAREVGAWTLAVGTDFVFPGDGGAPYAEDDTPRPISVYGSSKLLGEEEVLDADPAFAVARTAWVFGGAGKHFPRTVLNVLRSRGGMEVVDDEVGSPTFAGDLAEALVALIDRRPGGILHLTNSGAVSRFGLAQAVAAAAGLDPALVQPTTTAEFLAKYPLPAKRPANSTLANTRAAALGVTLRPWQEAVDAYVPRLAAEPAS